MYVSKTNIFNYLEKVHKTELCTFISKYVKKYFGKSADEIVDFFFEEEQYYLEVGNPRHFWVEEYLEDSKFRSDLSFYVRENIKKYEYKEAQKPYIEKQKAFQKEQRKKSQEYKMSHEPATKAQISYYKALCRDKGLDKNIIDVEKASKLDLKNTIENLLSEKSKIEKEELLSKLNSLIKDREFNS